MNSRTNSWWVMVIVALILVGTRSSAQSKAAHAREGVKEDSPLAALLSRADAARDGQTFGERHDGLLVPEIVEFDGAQVGRFEITRAQYAEFDSGFKLKPGEENLPATGMGYVKAYKYVLWLAARTGKQFRLPTDEEAQRLGKLAKGGGNTLDYWLGHPPKADEVARVRQMAAAAAGPTALLMPVGTLGAATDRSSGQVVFDLNGNAAEWARNKDGDGVIVGRSADQPENAGRASEPGESYRGFRVVLDVTP